MKLRLGFVTNSSSTNHIIMWQGSKNELQSILMDRIEMFPDHYGGYNHMYEVDRAEIVYAILSKLPQAMSKEEMEKELQSRLEHAQDWYEKSKTDSWSSSYALEYLNFMKELVESAEKKDWMLEVYFGDNEGDFEGGDLGYVMDYEGRKIDVEEDKITYKTIQNR